MKRIKIYFLFLFISFTIQLSSQDLWETIKSPVDVNLRRVIYLDSLHVWAAGDSGTIIFSSDMGKNWNIQNSGLPERIEDIFFLNDSLGWALTWISRGTNYQSQILYTTDGGVNWESKDYRTSDILLVTIFFLDSLNGWVCGTPFNFSFTKDGGVNWSPANIDTGSFAYYTVNEIKFSTPQFGLAVGGVHDAIGVVWRTSNGGELWKAYGIGPDPFLDFIFLDSVTAFALTAELEGFYPTGELRFDILKSRWAYNDLNEYVYVTGLDQRTDYETWGTIGHGTKSFLLSNDTLKTWRLVETPDSLSAYDIDFADSLHGIAVGERGHIFRYIPQKPVSVIDDNIDETPGDFILYQNYPNPFNPVTKIKFQIPLLGGVRGWLVTLKVYDVLGNEIAVLVNENKEPGNYEIEFNADRFNLSSGIYFYQIKSEDFISAKKFVLMK